MTTYLACMGTRPEIIKMAPLVHALRARGHRVLVLHTGQHEAVAQALYRFFDMLPDRSIALERRSGRLGDLTSALLEAVDGVIAEVAPDVVLVQGDTSSAFAGAMAAYLQDRPVAHIEAGLRTGERDPFPEEKNRELIGRLARWHFSPTHIATDNLLREGIDPTQVHEVGNTVIDAAIWVRQRMTDLQEARRCIPSGLLDFLQRQAGRRLFLVTAHRRENWGQPIRDIARAVGEVLARHPDSAAVWPVHPNPRVRDDVETVVATFDANVRARCALTDPLDYPALIAVLSRCHFTLTDSGGIQEEASAFAVPVLIARMSTERQELVNAGGARLVGTAVEAIVGQASRLLDDPAAHRAMQVNRSPFGDGHAATRIAELLSRDASPRSSPAHTDAVQALA